MSRKNLNLALATAALSLSAFAPTMAQASDSFLSRAFTGHHEEGRWINRRLTIRHEGQDAPRFAPPATRTATASSRAPSARREREDAGSTGG